MTTTTAPKATKSTSALIEDMIIAEDRAAAYAAEAAELKTKLLARIALGESVESELARITHAQGSSTTFDFDAMVEAKPTWMRKVTKKVIDTPKFNLLRKAGAVPDELLAFVTTEPTAAYLKVTRR